MKHRSNRSCILLAFMVLGVFFCAAFRPVQADEEADAVYRYDTARPSSAGHLHVQGTSLADENGDPVQLRGVSSHGLTWYPGFIEPDFVRGISDDWNCNMIRLAMYSQIYCGEEKEQSLALLEKGIDAAVAADMYVLVDWHILEDYDPNQNRAEAAAFFDYISAKYAGLPNMLYEICNEPNGEAHWSDVITYSNEIIPIIWKNDPGAVVVVGTPEYDRNLSAAYMRPLAFDNVLYVLHFYAASHHEDLRSELDAALAKGLPVFISECGICEADGDGTIDFRSAADWFTYLKEHDLSYAVWSLSDKDESSAFFRPGYVPSGIPETDDLTESGRWVRELIRGADPQSIPVPSDILEKSDSSRFRSWMSESVGPGGYSAVRKWHIFALASALCVLAAALLRKIFIARTDARSLTYDDIYTPEELRQNARSSGMRRILARAMLLVSAGFTLVYLCWRVTCSIPAEAGFLAVGGNLILLAVELLGFAESIIMYENMIGMNDHPLPQIPDEAYPDVDIFIATYNEPPELLRKTINGCCHLRYPDLSKVHIWVCDDNRRKEMRELAAEMGVGYFDRPDNEGAKAGNLNHALALTSAPCIVTLDADMIPKSDFLLKTIPYFVDAEQRSAHLDENMRVRLGVLQTPQCFYDPDVFQHALYSEKRAPNEQDFFYRTIEVAKTASNSVIYGGSNTVLSRSALEDIGGFYTGSITEDFATGLLIESHGYVSLGLPEPLASGQTPHTYKEHIKQRTRWARGVIATARQLKIWGRKGLNLRQKINYWSSVIYWYSPLKNLVYMLSPLMYAAFAIPVFKCSWLELAVYWMPMYIMQDACLRYVSRNAISLKWSGIYETSVMPHLFFPVLKESMGITLSAFKVTDKSGKGPREAADVRTMMPFLVLVLLSLLGIIRVCVIMDAKQAVSMAVLLFWLIRNLYFLIMALFLIDGRESDGEAVKVIAAEPVLVEVEHGRDKGKRYEGITTLMTEHKLSVYLDEGGLTTGTPVSVTVDTGAHKASFGGTVSDVRSSRSGNLSSQTIEILDFRGQRDKYLEILYDRVPTLPQSLHRDFGVLGHLWQNIAHRVARTTK